MRDFKYRQLLLGRDEWEAVLTKIASLRSDALKDCAFAFSNNLNRTALSAMMPAELAFVVRRDQIFFDNAIWKILGKSEIRISDLVTDVPPQEVSDDVARQRLEFEESNSMDEKRSFTGRLGVNYIEALLSVAPAMQDNIDAMFGSVILGSWTAFECLASDLWTVGVDTGPQEIGARLNLSNQLQKGEENITTKTLHAVEANFKTQHGSWLREVGKVSFQKLEHIKLYYSIAFGDDFKKAFTETSDGYIFALAAVRNALIHKSGIADRKFVEQAQRFPELKEIKVGDRILLDGVLVKKLRLAAATVGADLVARVDSLLSPIPT